MLYEIDEEHRKNCEMEMGQGHRDIEDLKEREKCIWDDNAYAIDEDFSRRQPSLWFTMVRTCTSCNLVRQDSTGSSRKTLTMKSGLTLSNMSSLYKNTTDINA